MKPVWIIDDDRSIRWVFEKALTRENIAFKTFASAREALVALEEKTRCRCEGSLAVERGDAGGRQQQRIDDEGKGRGGHGSPCNSSDPGHWHPAGKEIGRTSP